MSHKLITLLRIIKAGTQNFIRNATLAIAAMAVMIITLTIVLFSVIANATFTHTVQTITDKIDVSVYLKDTVTVEQRNKLMEDVRSLGNVRGVEYVSKEQALKIFSKDNPDQLAALAQVENPLPASLTIKPRDPNRLEEIKSFLEKKEVLELQSAKTSYSGDRKEAIDKITKATRFFRQVGFAGVIVFTIVSMLIIFNTIRMAIFNRRDELTIMRLLGASTWYIRGPFVVETILYGIVSAVISVTLCNTLFIVSSSAFDASSLGLLDIKFSNDYFASHFWIILTSQIAIGIIIGAASSLIATRRYLKFKSSK